MTMSFILMLFFIGSIFLKLLKLEFSDFDLSTVL